MPCLLIYSGHSFNYKTCILALKNNTMKIEIIKEVAGMEVGTVKTVDDLTAKDLVNHGWAKDSAGKYKSGDEPTDDLSSYLTNNLDAEEGEKEEKEPAKRKTKEAK